MVQCLAAFVVLASSLLAAPVLGMDQMQEMRHQAQARAQGSLSPQEMMKRQEAAPQQDDALAEQEKPKYAEPFHDTLKKQKIALHASMPPRSSPTNNDEDTSKHAESILDMMKRHAPQASIGSPNAPMSLRANAKPKVGLTGHSECIWPTPKNLQLENLQDLAKYGNHDSLLAEKKECRIDVTLDLTYSTVYDSVKKIHTQETGWERARLKCKINGEKKPITYNGPHVKWACEILSVKGPAESQEEIAVLKKYSPANINWRFSSDPATTEPEDLQMFITPNHCYFAKKITSFSCDDM